MENGPVDGGGVQKRGKDSQSGGIGLFLGRIFAFNLVFVCLCFIVCFLVG